MLHSDRSSQQQKFPLGRIVITPGAAEQISEEDVLAALNKHQRGDWGNLSADDKQENELSLREGCRLLSAYEAADGIKFWIITEADRSLTTILLPEEY